MKRLYYYLSIALILALLSCGSEGDEGDKAPIDTENPTINISKPVNNAMIGRGTELLLSGVFEDDLELKNIEVSLSFSTIKGTTGIDDPWEPAAETIDLSGKHQELTDVQLFGEMIPSDCKPGGYKLTLVVTDMVDKSTTKEISFTVI